MNKKLKKMWIFNFLMWACLVAAIISMFFSKTAYYILMGCWLVFITGNFITCIIFARSIKKEEQQTLIEWDEIWKQQWEGYSITADEEIKPSVTIKPADKADDGTKE